MSETSLGRRIEHARTAKGLSQAELARRLAIKPGTLSSWEQDRSTPRANLLNTLAGILGVSLLWLLNGDDSGGTGAPVEQDDMERVRRKLAQAGRLHTELAALLQEISTELSPPSR